MKKLFTKLAAIMLSVVCVLTCATGCKKEEQGVAGQTLNIYVLEQAFGRDWLLNTIEAFKEEDWVKQKYPELVIPTPTINNNVQFSGSQLGLGTKNKYDILFGSGSNKYFGDDNVLYDLTDSVYKAKIPDEEITYGEKLNSTLRTAYGYFDPATMDETRYYSTPYMGGWFGFIYNEDALMKYTTKVPNTTDEFIAVVDAIYEANKGDYGTKSSAQYAFMRSNDSTYIRLGGLPAWWAQYDGVQGYTDFYNGILNEQRSVDIFKEEGRLEALKVWEYFLDYDNKFFNPISDTEKYIPAQTAFLRGGAVFHFNGDYFVPEMMDVKEDLVNNGVELDTFKMMRMPVISAIIAKCTTIENDAELSALITAIDAGSKSLTGTGYDVNQDDFNKIYEARLVVYPSVGMTQGAVIPAVSQNKELASDFMLYMASNKGIEIYAEATGGCEIGFNYNIETANPELFAKLDTLQQDRIKYFNSVSEPIILQEDDSFPLFAIGGVQAVSDTRWEITMSAKGNTKTAQDLFQATINSWTQNAFDLAIQKAGIQ